MSNCSTGKEPRGAQLAGRKKIGTQNFFGINFDFWRTNSGFRKYEHNKSDFLNAGEPYW
jgi:hypothetical protein